MVQLGTVITDNADRLVSSAGTHFINDGWEPILRITADRLPGTATSPDYAFVVSGEMGEFRKPLSTTGEHRATAEIMVVEEGFLSPSTRHIVDMDDILTDPRKGHAFQVIFSGASWGPTKTLVVLGRTFQRAPIPAYRQPSFIVSSLAVQAWNLTALGMSRSRIEAFTHTGGANLAHLPTSATGGTLLATLASDMPFSGPGPHRWLVYHSVSVIPGTRGAAYSTWMTRLAGSEGDAWGFDNNGSSAMGPAPGVAEWGTYHLGMARVFEVADGNTRFRVRGGTSYPAPDGPAQALRTVILAVKIDECAGFHEFEEQSTAGLYGRNDAPTTTEREIVLDAAMPYNVLSISAPQNDAGRAMGFDCVAGYNGRDQWTPRLSLVHKHSTDGMAHWRVLSRPFDDQLAIFGSRTQVAVGEVNPPVAMPGRWSQVVGWVMDDAAIPSPIPAIVAGPEVVVVPGREALGLGSLSVLPVIPSRAHTAQATVQRVELETMLGYRVTWPRALKPRREVSLSWDAITYAEVQTLVAFFETTLTFKWTIPGDIERPYALLSFDVDASDMGRQHYRMRASVVDLVFVGTP